MANRLGWKVDRVVTDQTVNVGGGDPVVGNYIYYTTAEGNHGVVFVSNDKFHPKHVAETIRPEARKLDEVAALAENFIQG